MGQDRFYGKEIKCYIHVVGFLINKTLKGSQLMIYPIFGILSAVKNQALEIKFIRTILGIFYIRPHYKRRRVR